MASPSVGVLLDASGQPLNTSRPGAFGGPADYQPTTVIVQGGGQQVTLTPSEGRQRTISYSDIYETQPAVGAAVNKLVRQIATVPLKVYQRPKNGKTVNGRAPFPEEVWDHPLVDLLNKPAPGHGPVSLKEWLTMPTFVHGNSLVAKYRANGPNTPPTECIPLEWRYLQAWARIGEPVLVWATVQTGAMKWILPSETIHVSWAAPSGWLGVSPLRQLGVTVRLEEAAQRYASASFANGARPSGAIVLPSGVDPKKAPELMDRIQARVEEVHGGVDQAFKVAVLGGGADWRPMSFTAVEAGLEDSRQRNLAEVGMVYDLPPRALGAAPESGTAEEDNAYLFKVVLRPHFAMIADRLQAQLVDPEPEWAKDNLFLGFDLTEQLAGDPVQLSANMVAEASAGLRTANEARVVLGLAPSDDPAADQLSYLTRAGAGQLGSPAESITETFAEKGTPGQPIPPA